MKRRDFIKLSALSAALLLAPSNSYAYEYPSYDGPLWIFIHVNGGWDPTMVCNPQPSLNNLAKAKTPKKVGNIEYLSFNDDTDTFFEKYYNEMLIINGITAQTNAHSAGFKNFVSGELERDFPTFGALLTNAYRLESPIGHMMTGGTYRYTAGIASTIAVRSGRDVLNLAHTDAKANFSKPLYRDSINQRLIQAKKARLERLIAKHSSLAVVDELNKYKTAHESSSRILDVIENIDKGIYGGRQYGATHLGMAGFASNKMTLVINTVESGNGGFDTHGDHDAEHPLRLDNLYIALDQIAEDAKALGIWEDTIIVPFSDMGRTPEYNTFKGKDHWPVTSLMMIGPRVQGNRVIGKTSAALEPTKLNPETLEVDEENGVEINYADINQLFRRYSKIENTTACKKYKLRANEFNMDAFFT